MNTCIRSCLIVIFCLLISASGRSQKNSTTILLSDLEKNTEKYDGDTSTEAGKAVKAAYTRLLKEADRTGDHSHVSEGALKAGMYAYGIRKHDDALFYFNECIRYEKDSHHKDRHNNSARARRFSGDMHLISNSYQKALTLYLDALDTAIKYGLKDEESATLNNLSVVYIKMYDPRNLPNTKKGMEYAAKAIEILGQQSSHDKNAIRSLAVAYNNYGDLSNNYGKDSRQRGYQQKAILAYEKALDLFNEIDMKGQKCGVYGNIAYAWKDLGNREKYHTNLLNAYNVMQNEAVSLYEQEGIHYALGEYYYEEGNKEKSLYHLKEAEKLLASDPARDYQIMALLKGLGQKIYAAKGDHKKAYEYLSAYQKLNDSLLNAETLRKFEETEVKYQSERKSQQLKEAALSLENAHLMRNAVIVVAVLLALSLFLFYRSYTAKNKALLFKKEAADVALQKAALEIEANREILDRHTQSLMEKSHLIDDLEKQLTATGKADDAALSKLSNSRILTREDWAEYKRLFDKVYPGFFIKIRQKYPDITDADERILAFSKLNINLKEAADLIGISYDSMKNSRYRLRKKMGIDNETAFRDITENI
jgi:tetratricopeptide (TPR) repeat protein